MLQDAAEKAAAKEAKAKEAAAAKEEQAKAKAEVGNIGLENTCPKSGLRILSSLPTNSCFSAL